MRIKRLELHGFKSFVERTVLGFSPGVSAIVGPNGCGKSNVVDAIRWCLGEQSPKHLRGSAMEDVVFKGNDRRPPVGMAEVSLTFDHDPTAQESPEDGEISLSTLPAHVLGLSEITVTRRYFRSGESEYLINKQPCRLRDITELFLGTGAGTKAYSIIEQGRVEQLISAKPEDRRWFIEEAAGTTLYRTRRAAAERKMERTRDNLLRLGDILREVERQIQYLNRQAKKAEQYRSVQAEIRAIETAFARAQWRELAAELVRLGEALQALDAAESRAQEGLEVAVQARGRAQVSANEAEQHLSGLREHAARRRAEADTLRQRRDWNEQQLQERHRRLERLRVDAGELDSRLAGLGAEAELIVRQLQAHAERLGREESVVQRVTERVEERRNSVAAAASGAEQAKDRVVGLLAGEADLRNQMAAIERREVERCRRLERLEAEQVEAAERLAATDAELDARRGSLERMRGRLSELEGERDERVSRLRTLAQERRDAEEHAKGGQEQLLQLRSRLQSIQEIQRTYEGYERGVRAIMVSEEPREGVLGVVGEVITAPQQYERAVAAVLGDRLQYVIVAGADRGVDAVRSLRDADAGRGSFIPQAPRKLPLNPSGLASLNGSTRPLLDLVHVEDGYRELAELLLGDVVLVPDLGTALSLWRRNGVYVTMVTPEGDVMDPCGVITGGSERPVEEQILSRRRETQELEAAIDVASSDLDQANVVRLRVVASEAAESAALRELDSGVHQVTVDAVAAQKDCERLEAERPRWTDRLEAARFEAGGLAEEAESGRAEAARLRDALYVSQAHRAELELELQARQIAVNASKTEVEALLEELTAARVSLAESRERQVSLSARGESVERQRAEAQKRLADLQIEKTEVEAESAALTAEATRLAEAIAVSQGEVEDLETAVEAAAAGLEGRRSEVDAAEGELNRQRELIDAVRGQRGVTETSVAERRLRQAHLEESMREKYAMELAVEAGSEEGPSEIQPEMPARLEELRQRLARIGEVNVGAIEELQELEQRAQFLRAQKEDLESSLTDLEQTIRKLNRASRDRFRETFEQVDHQFRAVFPRLFRGGEARLMLTDESNILESGVEIYVRPPGKKLDTVTLLSGGEKALVAVSLIFALFLIRPTPYCFLDEVDAPLDDANVGRFVQMVREISGRTQFILITHNKRTMQAADCLYGVTMEEPGVSKVISVAMR